MPNRGIAGQEWDGVERRHFPDHMQALEDRLDAATARIESLETSVAKNNEMTAEIHGWVGNAKGFFSVLGIIGNAVKWVSAIVMACVVLYGLWKAPGGTLPPGGGSP
jgi:hypothetical protein